MLGSVPLLKVSCLPAAQQKSIFELKSIAPLNPCLMCMPEDTKFALQPFAANVLHLSFTCDVTRRVDVTLSRQNRQLFRCLTGAEEVQ